MMLPPSHSCQGSSRRAEKLSFQRRVKAKFFRVLTGGSVLLIVLFFLGLLASIVSKALPLMWVEEVALQMPPISGNFQSSKDSVDSAGRLEDVLRYDASVMVATKALAGGNDKKERDVPGAATQEFDQVDTLHLRKLLSRKAWTLFEVHHPSYASTNTTEDTVKWLPLRYGLGGDPGLGGLTPDQKAWLQAKKATGQFRRVFNWGFFTRTDSLSPEMAGIAGAFLGTLYVLVIAFIVAFPLGLGAALYLESFADKNRRLIRFVSLNINNLAAVPSVIFGLIGLTLFISLGGLARSSSLVGGLTLSLMMLPLIIVSCRLSLSQVPSTLEEAALGLGASPFQAVFHHVVPVAMPSIVTGTLLCIARMIGESAPLLMVGMVIFSSHVPTSVNDATTVLPVLIYQWFQRPEAGFIEASSGAIVALLGVLFVINSVALIIRKKFATVP